MPRYRMAWMSWCAVALLAISCTAGGSDATTAGPSSSDCDMAGVGATCSVTVDLIGNQGSHHGVAFSIVSQAFELLIPGSETGDLTAGCLISNGATRIGVVCGDAFTGDGIIAVLSFRRATDGQASFVVEDAVLISDDLLERRIRGGALVVR